MPKVSKVILNGNTVMDVTQDTTNADRTLTGYTGHKNDGEEFTGRYMDGIGGSIYQDDEGYVVLGEEGKGGYGWVRPSSWPDYSKLKLRENETEAMFFTYDNTYYKRFSIPTYVGLGASTSEGNYLIQRVTINNDGTVTVLDTVTRASGNVYQDDISNETDDYICLMVTPETGHITRLYHNKLGYSGADNDTAGAQKCVEHYGYIPYCTIIGYEGSAYRRWGTTSLISDTILGMPEETSIDFYLAYNLVNVNQDYWTKVKPNANGFLDGTRCLQKFDFSKIDFSATTSIQFFFRRTGIRNMDLSRCDMRNVTNTQYAFQDAINIDYLNLPTMERLTTYQGTFFSNRYGRICVIDLNENTASIPQNTFQGTSPAAIILRADSVVTLSSTTGNNLGAINAHIFVPEELVDDYKSATNWSSFASYIYAIPEGM